VALFAIWKTQNALMAMCTFDRIHVVADFAGLHPACQQVVQQRRHRVAEGAQEHVLPDERRVQSVLSLLRLGYADRMVLSHDAAFYSRVTPPSWRAAHAPNWHIENLSRRILPMVETGGANASDLNQMMVLIPRRILEPARP
jgi:hypothetical protein